MRQWMSKGREIMLIDKELHEYICDRTWDLTEHWYETLDKSQGGIYSTSDPEKINTLKKQNHAFHVRFCDMFAKERADFLQEFQDWINEIAEDEEHISTPLVSVIGEFLRTQEQYLRLIGDYVAINQERISYDQLNTWNLAVVRTISDIILKFTQQSTDAAQKRLQKQQEIIVEMSAPVILLTQNTGLLPLIGEITSHRAQTIFEKTLKQSSKHNLEKLFVDLSGVPVIDTMVAQQIFHLIKGLKIIGVKTALSGISPVIAQTAVHLGIKFIDIEVYNTLAQALKQNDIEFLEHQ
jgi:rsbT co-antagonist protein RsbR